MSYYPEYQVPKRNAHRALAYVFAAFLLILIITMVLTIPLGAYQVFSTSWQTVPGSSTPSSVPLIYFFVTLIPIVVPNNTVTIAELFLVLWVVYLVFFALTLNGSFSSLVGALKGIRSRGTDALFDNSAFAFTALFPPLFWATVLLEILQSQFNVSTGSLNTSDALGIFVDVTFAPLREEFGFRVIIIGLVAFFILISRRAGLDSLKALWQPSKYLQKHSTPTEARGDYKVMWIAIGASALVFGLAHFLLGGGWGPGKISEAALTGLGLGWLYYRYGFPAAVLLHWSFNYFDWVLTQFYGSSNTLESDLLDISYLILLSILAIATTSWLVSKLVRRTRPHQPELMPPSGGWGQQPPIPSHSVQLDQRENEHTSGCCAKGKRA